MFAAMRNEACGMITVGEQDWFDPAYMPKIPENLFSLPKGEARQYICRAPISLEVKAQLLRKLGDREQAGQAQTAFDRLTKDKDGFLCVEHTAFGEDHRPFSLFLGVFDSYEDFCALPAEFEASEYFTLHHYTMQEGKPRLLEIYDWYMGKLCWFVGEHPHPFAPITVKNLDSV